MVRENRTGKLYAAKKIRCHSKRDEQRAKQEIELHRMLNAKPHVIQLEASSSCVDSSSHTLRYSGNGELLTVEDFVLILPFYKVIGRFHETVGYCIYLTVSSERNSNV